MRFATPMFLVATLSTACTPTEPKDSGDLLDDIPLTSGCVPIEDEPQAWNETLQFTSQEDAGKTVSFSSPMSRGQGILRAEVSWSPYAGGPDVGFTNGLGEKVSAHVYPEDTPSAVAEAMVGAGDTVVLDATQFGTGLEEEYPITLSVSFSWTPMNDCWEDNTEAGETVDLPLDEPAEALLQGSHGATGSYVHLSHDDHYRVQVPEGATRLLVDASFPVTDGSLALSAYRLDEGPTSRTGETYAGGSYSSSATLDVEVTPGDWVVFVQKWEGEAFDAWATKADDGPSRPDSWDTPYTLVARVQ